jgi:hypothetical protein
MARTEKRCPRCLYLRHPNDARFVPPDICPRCGKVYGKTQHAVDQEQRRRSFARHPLLRATTCAGCHETVPGVARTCPYCGRAVPTGGGLRRVAIAALALLALTMGNPFKAERPPLRSSLPNVSDRLFTNCVRLSAALEDARRTGGVTSPDFLRVQNRWHGECSRKALRNVAEFSVASFPVTPGDWLALGRS